ncbi:MAG: hypothetical protein IJM01_02360 [Eubacterium sp.]|nr:hypothetical protein [Eubacterium sp.]
MNECETCSYYLMDDDGEEYCDLQLDEDEYARFLADKSRKCPDYQDCDDYKIVRHQM